MAVASNLAAWAGLPTTPIWTTSCTPNFYSTSSNNYGKYSNPEFDKLVEEARKVTDEDERKSEYREACKLLGEDMPVIPIMFYAHDHIGSERIQSLYYDPAGIAHLGEASVQA